MAYISSFETICKNFVTVVIFLFRNMQENHSFNSENYPQIVYSAKFVMLTYSHFLCFEGLIKLGEDKVCRGFGALCARV